MNLPQGITTHQAHTLLTQWGENVISESGGRRWWQVALAQFKSALVVILVLAAAVAWWIGDRVDAGLILAIVILNATLTFVQELKAEDAIKKLKQQVSFKVRVIRDGQEQEIDSRYLVPGDVMHIEAGNKVAADGKIVWETDLEVSEAVLTGESLPLAKQLGEAAYAGTMVVKGRGWVLIEQTASRTRFGSIARSLQQLEETASPLQKNLARLSRLMMIVGLVACGVMVVATQEWLTGVSLAVAVIPEGLPAVIALALAVGAQRLSFQAAVVRRLSAIEALGAATVVASDKTGTITQNIMEVKKVVMGEQEMVVEQFAKLPVTKISQIVNVAVMCNSAVLVQKHDHGSFAVVGDETEGALLKLAHKLGSSVDRLREELKIVKEFPFDVATRLMTVVVKDQASQLRMYTKGAPEAVLKVCTISSKAKQVAEAHYQSLARQGLRVIALASKNLTSAPATSPQVEGLHFLGMTGIADPVRPEARATIEEAKLAGLRVVMITGDNELTAYQIAKEAGLVELDEEILTGQEMDRLDDVQLVQEISRVRVFARIKPEHKLRIVKAFQSRGELVVMTGDGVNDALALKQADVGVAMGKTGTDVAREVADVVLVDDNLATIIRAIEYGRTIMANISRSVRYLLTCNLAEVVTILAVVFLGRDLPLLPVQILWINLVTDGLPALALAMDSSDGKNLQSGPIKLAKGWVLGRTESLWILLGALAMALAGSLAFWWGGRGAVFSTLVGVQLVAALVIRGFRAPTKWLTLAVVSAALLQVLIMTVPQLRAIFKV